ncbi:cytochrome P450 [Thermocatellispora tengchongensis]|uniref:Cytochrome P450 n=1 Tax=Thermocatellispora tengchongensis TaxID=1073253 RepID=A0A840PJ04_9ACTN|nr:cytochrome P450 [Thermocatellispora tengchongensis]MBB5139102.1 cytochrome P450 [Thermocatellispora tengchongensis]
MPEEEFPLVQFTRERMDPVAELAAIREEHPVYPLKVPGGSTVWLVTRYEDVRAVLGDAERFSNDFGNVIAAGGSNQEDPGGLGFRDPPEHTRLRKLLTPEFTMRRLRRLEPRITAIVEEHLDALEAAGPPADLLKSFALPIPSLVVCELLGVPYDERAEFLRLSTDRFDFSAGPEASLQAVNDSMAYLTELVARERRDPGDGLLGRLIRDHGGEVGDRELASLADGLLTGGHDTSTSMLSLGTLWLLENPRELAAVRDGEDGHVSRVIEELLRYLTVVQVAFPRFAREDLVLAGQPIAKGEMVLCSLAAANRDPALGPDADRVDPTRERPTHLAFGHGIHHCVGAPLARMEMRIAFPALLRRFPGLRLSVPPEEVPFREIAIVYGVEALPVAW